jgi:hypothetical protein
VRTKCHAFSTSRWTFSFDDNEWIHNDELIDPNSDESHRYFDFSWDISRIYENLHTRKRQLARQLSRAVQKNALLRKQLGLPKYLASDPSDLATNVSEGVPIPDDIPPDGFQVSKGVITS